MKQGLAAHEIELFDVVEQLSDPLNLTIEDLRAGQGRRASRTEVTACPTREVAVVGDLNIKVGQKGFAAQHPLPIPQASRAKSHVRRLERVRSGEDVAPESLTNREWNRAAPSFRACVSSVTATR